MNVPQSGLGACRVLLDPADGWRKCVLPGGTVWVNGSVHDNDATLGLEQTAARLMALPADPASLRRALAGFDGMFAAVVERPGVTIAIVDHVATVPLLVEQRDGRISIAGRARSLGHDGRLSRDGIDADAARILAMSSYTIGDATLLKAVKWMPAGTFAVVTGDRVERGAYYVYAAWEAEEEDGRDWSGSLEALLVRLFERTARALGGRTALVPLSAGLDSRLIVSGLHRVGYRNVKCFAYGQHGNFEARASRQIAERLGFAWTFVPYSQGGQRAAIGQGGHARYRSDADTLAAVPFEQDYFAIAEVLRTGFAPRDGVVINGQSGDFITGNHIPAALGPERAGASNEWDSVFAALVGKHHTLWRSLLNDESLGRLREAVDRELREVCAPERPRRSAFGYYEYVEYRNRQSKYVLGGQRVYDHFGLAWRLPLWELPFVEFWRTAPLAAKYRQRLYRETLLRMNWGGVWLGIEDRRHVTPRWIVPLRHALRAAAAPLGRDRWHAVERQTLSYWTDVVCNFAEVPYSRVLFDRRGFRNAISWLTESYLGRHGINWDGTLPAS